MGLFQSVVRAPLAAPLTVRPLPRGALPALYALRRREAPPSAVGTNVEYLCRDALDPFALQLVVQGEDQALLGAVRILPPADALAAGGGFAEAMFDLGGVCEGAPVLEASWPVVAFVSSRRAVAAVLVEAVVRHAQWLDLGHVLACVGVSRQELATLKGAVHARAWVPPLLRVRPWMRLPHAGGVEQRADVALPPLLDCLLGVGARIAGEAAWDPGLQRAVVPLRLDLPRYGRG